MSNHSTSQLSPLFFLEESHLSSFYAPASFIRSSRQPLLSLSAICLSGFFLAFFPAWNRSVALPLTASCFWLFMLLASFLPAELIAWSSLSAIVIGNSCIRQIQRLSLRTWERHFHKPPLPRRSDSLTASCVPAAFLLVSWTPQQLVHSKSLQSVVYAL